MAHHVPKPMPMPMPMPMPTHRDRVLIQALAEVATTIAVAESIPTTMDDRQHCTVVWMTWLQHLQVQLTQLPLGKFWLCLQCFTYIVCWTGLDWIGLDRVALRWIWFWSVTLRDTRSKIHACIGTSIGTTSWTHPSHSVSEPKN